jgi:hypothetical protein
MEMGGCDEKREEQKSERERAPGKGAKTGEEGADQRKRAVKERRGSENEVDKRGRESTEEDGHVN